MPVMPKDPKIRQRQNKSTTKATLPAEGEVSRRRKPSLPAECDGKPWHEMTIAWWRDIWRSPMAGEYLKADVHGLFRLAVLINLFWLEPSPLKAAEIRQQEQRFGLSPLDRRRLEWTVANAEDATDRRRKKVAQQQKPVAPVDDPRRLLSIV